jgi:hypothetical protein
VLPWLVFQPQHAVASLLLYGLIDRRRDDPVACGFHSAVVWFHAFLRPPHGDVLDWLLLQLGCSIIRGFLAPVDEWSCSLLYVEVVQRRYRYIESVQKTMPLYVAKMFLIFFRAA